VSWADEKPPFVERQYALIRLHLPELSVKEASGYADVCARVLGFPMWGELADTEEFWVEQRAEMLQLPEVAR
jgi:hypothetical protein